MALPPVLVRFFRVRSVPAGRAQYARHSRTASTIRGDSGR